MEGNVFDLLKINKIVIIVPVTKVALKMKQVDNYKAFSTMFIT